jgi:hypothetical protein
MYNVLRALFTGCQNNRFMLHKYIYHMVKRASMTATTALVYYWIRSSLYMYKDYTRVPGYTQLVWLLTRGVDW